MKKKINPENIFVTYTSSSDVIITTRAKEKKTKTLYFGKGNRDIEEYHRTEYNESEEAIEVMATLLV